MRTQSGSLATGSITGSMQAVITGASGDQVYIDNGTGWIVAVVVPGQNRISIVPAYGKLSAFGDFSGGNITAMQVGGASGGGSLIINAVQSNG